VSRTSCQHEFRPLQGQLHSKLKAALKAFFINLYSDQRRPHTKSASVYLKRALRDSELCEAAALIHGHHSSVMLGKERQPFWPMVGHFLFECKPLYCLGACACWSRSSYWSSVACWAVTARPSRSDANASVGQLSVDVHTSNERVLHMTQIARANALNARGLHLRAARLIDISGLASACTAKPSTNQGYRPGGASARTDARRSTSQF
jgi:hypothetical protein